MNKQSLRRGLYVNFAPSFSLRLKYNLKNMLRPIDNYFLQKEEPIKSCLQFLRALILAKDDRITETWKYGMPVFCYDGRMCCYLWIHKKYQQPYIGFVHGKLMNDPGLLQEKRAKMKIFLLDAGKDLPLKKIDALLKQAISIMQA